jgi:hypothetical protein
MRAMNGLGALAVIALTGWTFLQPAAGGWAFAAAEFAFLSWLRREMRRIDPAALLARAREPLDADESEIIRRYAFYFARPAVARECGSTLAATGLASLVLVSWLLYKAQWPQAAVIGIMWLAVGRLSKLLSPTMSLQLRTRKGDRDALRLLSAHDGAARKLLAPEQPGA